MPGSTALDHDLRCGRNQQIHRPALNDVNRLSAQRTRQSQFILAVGHLGLRGQRDHRVHADSYGQLQRPIRASARLN